MPKHTDQDYLLTEQYKDASNLNARINLHKGFSTNPPSLYCWIFDHLRVEPGQHILELGCGPGDLWRENIDRLPTSCRITLTDFSPGMLDQTRDNLSRQLQNLELALLDAQTIPFPAEEFDLVIANYVLFHIPDPASALSEIQRVLRSGGRLYAATNGRSHLQEIEALIQIIDPDLNSRSPVEGFSLENGAKQLLRHFSPVTLHRFEDSLRVTQVEPLVAYILSMDHSPKIKEGLERLSQLIQHQIDDQGSFFIRKATGMFEARKTRNSPYL